MRARPVAALVLAACWLLPPAARAQTESQVTLARKDTRIVVTLKAQYADGARFIGNNPNCHSGMRQTLLYGPAPGYVDTRVGQDTELRSNVAIVLTPAQGSGAGAAGAGAASTGAQAGAAGSGAAAAGNGATGNGATGNGATSSTSGDAKAGAAGGSATGTAEGSAGGAPANGAAPTSQAPAAPTPTTPAPTSPAPTSPAPTSPAPTTPAEAQTLELYDGTVTIDRPGCIASEKRATKPSVTLVQGRTTVKGTRFFLDQGSDTGTMDGPIQLERAAAGDSPALSASADRMRFDTQSRQATLLGNVRVTSQDRVTTADSLQLDEAAGIAVLTGSPARSTQGKDVLQGSRLRYYLNNNDVVVLGDVHGNLDVTLP